MPTSFGATVRVLGNILIAASSLFFIETAFEMYFLTVVQGPQMIFFSLAQIAPIALVAVFLSGIAFVCLAIFAFLVQLTKYNGTWKARTGYPKFMLVVLCVQVVHAALLLTYDSWAVAFFSERGI